MRKITLLLLLTAFQFAKAQDSIEQTPIHASDPTQLYTSVDVHSGLNFLYGNRSFDIDTWEFGFRGNFAINKFRIGVFLPVSNNSDNNEVFDDITIEAGYQLHNNSGLYNSTLINVGFKNASREYLDISSYDGIYSMYENSSAFAKIFANYTGAIKFNKRLSFYPGFEWSRESRFSHGAIFFVAQDSMYSASDILKNGIALSGLLSYDINSKNFIQLGGSWATKNWTAQWGSVEDDNEYFSSLSERVFKVNLRYQHAFTPYSQAYFNLQSYVVDYLEDGQKTNTYYEGVVGIQLGFRYFLH